MLSTCHLCGYQLSSFVGQSLNIWHVTVGNNEYHPQYCLHMRQNLFIYLGFHVTSNTVQTISRLVVLWAEETSTYSWSRFCTVNCRPSVSNYQLYHLRAGFEPLTSVVGGVFVTTAPPWSLHGRQNTC